MQARIALAVMTLALLAAAPTASAALIDQVNGLTIDPSDPNALSDTTKLHPGAPPSSCNSPKSSPSSDSGGPFFFNGLAEESHINEPSCMTITYSTTDASCQANGLFSYTALVAYAGDGGVPPTDATPVTYSVVVPGGQFASILFNMSSANTGCASFDVSISSDRPWAYVRPPIRGHPYVGATLTSIDNLSVWNVLGSFTHQWRRCAPDGSACEDIPGATAGTYQPTPDDVGHTLRTRVTNTDSGKSSTADSDAVLIGIQFDAATAQSVSASDPTQTGRLSRSTTVPSCTAPRTFVPALVDPTHTRHYDAFRHTNASDSTLCTMVSVDYTATCSSDRPFSAAYLPNFDPTAVRNNYLADSGLSGTHGERTIRYSFGVPAGAAYDVVLSTVGAAVTCPDYEVHFGTASPYPTTAPTLDGTAQAGQTLTASDGAWTGEPTSFGYQWQRCFGDGSGCGDIPGATEKTLALRAKDVGDTFRVRVTATEGLGSASKRSDVSAAVVEAAEEPPPPPPPPAPGPPAYAGIALKPLTKVVGANGKVALTLTCPAEAVIGCAGTDALRLGKAALGSRSFALAPGKSTTLTFTLSKALRKRLAKRKTLKAAQLVDSFDVRGVHVRTTGKVTLKRAKRHG